MRKKRIFIVLLTAFITYLLSFFSLRMANVIKSQEEDSQTTYSKIHHLSQNNPSTKQSKIDNIKFDPSKANISTISNRIHVISNEGWKAVSFPSHINQDEEYERQPDSTRAEIDKMLKEIEEFRKRVNEESLAWGLEHINDMSLQPETREVYRLRLIMPLHYGHKAFEEKDYVTALREYQKALEDPLASPVSRYLTYQYMIEAARRLKDIDHYIEYLCAQAALIENEDLSALGLKKTSGVKAYFDERGKLLRAAKNPALIDEIVAERMRRNKTNSELSRKLTLESVKKEIESIERSFYHEPDI